MPVSGRQYTVGFNRQTIATVQDLIAIYPGAGKIIGIQSITLGQITLATVNNLPIRLRYLPTVVTSGSGGNAATPRPTNPGDAAATATARVNDTAQATTTGTAVDISDVWNIVNGYLWVPTVAGRPPLIGLSGAFVLSLDAAPGNIVASGMVTFEELP